jgi:hypothetical protein
VSLRGVSSARLLVRTNRRLVLAQFDSEGI